MVLPRGFQYPVYSRDECRPLAWQDAMEAAPVEDEGKCIIGKWQVKYVPYPEIAAYPSLRGFFCGVFYRCFRDIYA